MKTKTHAETDQWNTNDAAAEERIYEGLRRLPRDERDLYASTIAADLESARREIESA